MQNENELVESTRIGGFSQFCFLVGTAQAHAEETTAIQPTMEAIAQVASEVTEVQPAEAGVPAGEATVEQAPVTEAPTVNSKTTLDQTIGETQHPGNSPGTSQPVEETASVQPLLQKRPL